MSIAYKQYLHILDLEECVTTDQALATLVVADALYTVAKSLERLGNNGAISEHGTEIGAIENLAMSIEKGFQVLADQIDNSASQFVK